MAMFMRITLLFILASCTSLDQEPSLVIGKKGHDAEFYCLTRMSEEHEIYSGEPEYYYEEEENYSKEEENNSEEKEHYYLYRAMQNETLLLMSIKGNETVSNSQRIAFSTKADLASFILTDVSLADGGIYTIVEWRSAEHLVRTLSYRMAVCPKVSHLVFTYYSQNDIFRVDIDDFDPSQGDTLEVYNPGHVPMSHFHDVTIGTDACSLIFPSEQVSGLQVTQNGSSVWLSSSNWIDRKSYDIIIRKGKECQEVIEIEVRANVSKPIVSFEELHFSAGLAVVHQSGIDSLVFPRFPTVSLVRHMAWPGMKMAIPCGTDVKNRAQVEWETPEHLQFQASVAITNIGVAPHDKEMYIEDIDNSLVIPSVKSDHQGTYRCHAADVTTDHELNVCLDQGLTYVSFSLNDSLALSCHPGLKPMTKDTSSVVSGTTEWYYLSGQEIDVLFRKGQFGSAVPEDLRAKLEVSDDSNSLHISNLLPVDSGIYRCLQDCNSAPCFSRAFHLVYRDPFGIGSPFYRVYVSLLGTGLLLMICAVVCVNLRLRYGREYSKGKGKPADEEEGGERREEG